MPIIKFETSFSSKYMYATVISDDAPFQIEFENELATQSNPRNIPDIVHLVTYTPLIATPSLEDAHKAFGFNPALFYLRNYPLFSEKTFNILKDLFFLDVNQSLVTYYFEHKPFFQVIPPAVIKDEVKATPQERRKALEKKPEHWHYFRLLASDEVALISDTFQTRIQENKLTGSSVYDND